MASISVDKNSNGAAVAPMSDDDRGLEGRDQEQEVDVMNKQATTTTSHRSQTCQIDPNLSMTESKAQDNDCIVNQSNQRSAQRADHNNLSHNQSQLKSAKFKQKRPEPLKINVKQVDIPLDLSVKSGDHLLTLETPQIAWQDNEAILRQNSNKARLYNSASSNAMQMRLASLIGDSPPITPEALMSPGSCGHLNHQQVTAAAAAAAAATANYKTNHHYQHQHLINLSPSHNRASTQRKTTSTTFDLPDTKFVFKSSTFANNRRSCSIEGLNRVSSATPTPSNSNNNNPASNARLAVEHQLHLASLTPRIKSDTTHVSPLVYKSVASSNSASCSVSASPSSSNSSGFQYPPPASANHLLELLNFQQQQLNASERNNNNININSKATAMQQFQQHQMQSNSIANATAKLKLTSPTNNNSSNSIDNKPSLSNDAQASPNSNSKAAKTTGKSPQNSSVVKFQFNANCEDPFSSANLSYAASLSNFGLTGPGEANSLNTPVVGSPTSLVTPTKSTPTSLSYLPSPTLTPLNGYDLAVLSPWFLSTLSQTENNNKFASAFEIPQTYSAIASQAQFQDTTTTSTTTCSQQVTDKQSSISIRHDATNKTLMNDINLAKLKDLRMANLVMSAREKVASFDVTDTDACMDVEPEANSSDAMNLVSPRVESSLSRPDNNNTKAQVEPVWACQAEEQKPAPRSASAVPRILVSDNSTERLCSAQNVYSGPNNNNSRSMVSLSATKGSRGPNNRNQRPQQDKRSVSPRSFHARVEMYNRQRLESTSAPPDEHYGRSRSKVKSIEPAVCNSQCLTSGAQNFGANITSNNTQPCLTHQFIHRTSIASNHQQYQQLAQVHNNLSQLTTSHSSSNSSFVKLESSAPEVHHQHHGQACGYSLGVASEREPQRVPLGAFDTNLTYSGASPAMVAQQLQAPPMQTRAASAECMVVSHNHGQPRWPMPSQPGQPDPAKLYSASTNQMYVSHSAQQLYVDQQQPNCGPNHNLSHGHNLANYTNNHHGHWQPYSTDKSAYNHGQQHRQHHSHNSQPIQSCSFNELTFASSMQPSAHSRFSQPLFQQPQQQQHPQSHHHQVSHHQHHQHHQDHENSHEHHHHQHQLQGQQQTSVSAIELNRVQQQGVASFGQISSQRNWNQQQQPTQNHQACVHLRLENQSSNYQLVDASTGRRHHHHEPQTQSFNSIGQNQASEQQHQQQTDKVRQSFGSAHEQPLFGQHLPNQIHNQGHGQHQHEPQPRLEHQSKPIVANPASHPPLKSLEPSTRFLCATNPIILACEGDLSCGSNVSEATVFEASCSGSTRSGSCMSLPAAFNPSSATSQTTSATPTSLAAANSDSEADQRGLAKPRGGLESNGHASSSCNVVKRFNCDSCPRAFSRSDMLTRHKRLHSGVKPFACSQCDQTFSRSDHLTTHLRTHTGEKPFKCSKCSYSACRKDMITRHMKVHRRETPD